MITEKSGLVFKTLERQLGLAQFLQPLSEKVNNRTAGNPMPVLDQQLDQVLKLLTLSAEKVEDGLQSFFNRVRLQVSLPEGFLRFFFQRHHLRVIVWEPFPKQGLSPGFRLAIPFQMKRSHTSKKGSRR